MHSVHGPTLHLVVHLPAEVLQLHPGLLQGVFLHVVWRGVGQQLVQCDDVPGDLVIIMMVMIVMMMM